MPKSHKEQPEVPFLRKLLLEESESVKVPSTELLPMFLEKLRRLFE